MYSQYNFEQRWKWGARPRVDWCKQTFVKAIENAINQYVASIGAAATAYINQLNALPASSSDVAISNGYITFNNAKTSADSSYTSAYQAAQQQLSSNLNTYLSGVSGDCTDPATQTLLSQAYAAIPGRIQTFWDSANPNITAIYNNVNASMVATWKRICEFCKSYFTSMSECHLNSIPQFKSAITIAQSSLGDKVHSVYDQTYYTQFTSDVNSIIVSKWSPVMNDIVDYFDGISMSSFASFSSDVDARFDYLSNIDLPVYDQTIYDDKMDELNQSIKNQWDSLLDNTIANHPIPTTTSFVEFEQEVQALYSVFDGISVYDSDYYDTKITALNDAIKSTWQIMLTDAISRINELSETDAAAFDAAASSVVPSISVIYDNDVYDNFFTEMHHSLSDKASSINIPVISNALNEFRTNLGARYDQLSTDINTIVSSLSSDVSSEKDVIKSFASESYPGGNIYGSDLNTRFQLFKSSVSDVVNDSVQDIINTYNSRINEYVSELSDYITSQYEIINNMIGSLSSYDDAISGRITTLSDTLGDYVSDYQRKIASLRSEAFTALSSASTELREYGTSLTESDIGTRPVLLSVSVVPPIGGLVPGQYNTVVVTHRNVGQSDWIGRFGLRLVDEYGKALVVDPQSSYIMISPGETKSTKIEFYVPATLEDSDGDVYNIGKTISYYVTVRTRSS